jgi:hypothetical protein
MAGLTSEVSTICALAAAIVFAVSGLGKLARLARFRSALHQTYGMARPLAAIAAPIVCLAEVTAAGFLVSQEVRLSGIVLGLGLAGGFLTFSATALASGRKGDCGCLGGWTNEPLGGPTVLRAASLVTVLTVALALA